MRGSGSGAGAVPSRSASIPNHAAAATTAMRRPARPVRRQRRSGSSMMRVRNMPSPQGATAGGRVASTTSRMPARTAMP